MTDRKRVREDEAPKRKRASNTPGENELSDDSDGIEYEDAFEDEIEEEEIITEEMENLELGEEEDEEDDEEKNKKVWRPNVDKLGEGEVLEYESNTYDLYHVLRSDWPCLSIDIVPDKLGYMRSTVCTIIILIFLCYLILFNFSIYILNN